VDRRDVLRWLIRGRRDAPAFIAEMPGDTSSHPLTRPVIMVAVIRAAVMAGTVALAQPGAAKRAGA
jgi:hypothetical protein